MNRSNPANIIRKMNARSHLLFIRIQNPPEAAGPLKRCRFWKASLLLMCCSEIWIVLEREWIGAKCIRSDVLNQPWIESVCVCIWVNWYRCWLEPLGPVAWITDIQTSMKRRLQAAIWCFRACCPWEGHSCFLRKCHFRFQQIGCETCKVFRSRSTSPTHCIGNLWFTPSLHSFSFPSDPLTLFIYYIHSWICVAQLFAFPHFTPNGLLESVYVPLMYITHCGTE